MWNSCTFKFTLTSKNKNKENNCKEKRNGIYGHRKKEKIA